MTTPVAERREESKERQGEGAGDGGEEEGVEGERRTEFLISISPPQSTPPKPPLLEFGERRASISRDEPRFDSP